MRIFRQLTVILCFGFAGELLARYFPVTLPAGVWGLLLMLAALFSRAVKPAQLGETAVFLSANMSFFFLPLGVDLFVSYKLFEDVLFQLLAIAVIATIVTFFTAYFTAHFCRTLLAKRLAGRK
jgi:holin-like protein